MEPVAPWTASDSTGSSKLVSWFLIQKVLISTQLSTTQGNLNLSLFSFCTDFAICGVLTFLIDFAGLTPSALKSDTLDLEESSYAFGSTLDTDGLEGIAAGGSPQSTTLMMWGGTFLHSEAIQAPPELTIALSLSQTDASLFDELVDRPLESVGLLLISSYWPLFIMSLIPCWLLSRLC